MATQLLGKVALVTGASSGIGASIATKLVEQGMKVIGCARNVDKLQQLADSVNDQNTSNNKSGKMYVTKCDVSSESDVLELFKYTRDTFKTLHVCVNSAGLAYDSPILSGEVSEWKKMLDVNVLGVCLCSREACQLMMSSGVDDGHIINLNSLSSHRVVLPVYSASKFGVTALTEGLRKELRAANSKIRTTSISPGIVATDFWHQLNKGDDEKAVAHYSRFDCLKGEDIANTVLFALQSPPYMEVNEIILRPVEQAT